MTENPTHHGSGSPVAQRGPGAQIQAAPHRLPHAASFRRLSPGGLSTPYTNYCVLSMSSHALRSEAWLDPDHDRVGRHAVRWTELSRRPLSRDWCCWRLHGVNLGVSAAGSGSASGLGDKAGCLSPKSKSAFESSCPPSTTGGHLQWSTRRFPAMRMPSGWPPNASYARRRVRSLIPCFPASVATSLAGLRSYGSPEATILPGRSAVVLPVSRLLGASITFRPIPEPSSGGPDVSSGPS
jgi:hypothetical protein